MKILSFSMLAWGPFTDWSIDLSNGAEGLHLIYGPNEAGKSAALRGLKALLFGIDDRATDNFVHDYKNLRIAATLCSPDGETIQFIRKKGRTKTLLSPEGEAIEEGILQGFLGGVTADAFSSMFGLNHEELTAGGKEIASGRGDVGRSLFVAALGGHSIGQILGPLEEEAGKLFAPRAAKRSINLWLEQFQKAVKEAKEASLPGREWEEHTIKFKEADAKKTELQGEIRRMKSDLSRLERIGSALPLVGQRKELQKQRTDLGDVLALPEEFAATRHATVKALSEAQEKQGKAQKKLQDLGMQIDRLIMPAGLLSEADAINELHKMLGSHSDAMRQLPKRIGQAAQLEADAIAILNDIRPGATAEEADSFRIGLAQRKLIRELGSKHEALQATLQSVTTTGEKLKAKIEKSGKSLADLAAFSDPSRLKYLLNRVRKFGDLEAKAEKIRHELSAEIKECAIELQQLPLWLGTLEQLEGLALPENETISRYEKDFSEIEQKLKEVESRQTEKSTRESELTGNLKTLEMTTAVPTEENLTQARLRRESGWKLVRASWLEGDAPDIDTKAFGGDEPLDQAYSKSVLHADDVADRLRREADRVALHASLISERERISQEIRQLSDQGNKLSKGQLELQREWQEIWRTAGINPLPPLEMRSWVQKQQALAQRAETIRGGETNAKEIENQIEKLKLEILSELKQSGEEMPESIPDLNGLIENSQGLVDRIEKGNDERRKLELAISESDTELGEAARKIEEAEQELRQWRLHWAAAVKEIGLSESASTEVANQLLDRIQELVQKNQDLIEMRKRIVAMQHDSDAFKQRATELAARLAPDLVDVPAEGIATQLNTRLSLAREDEATRKQLSQQRQDQERELSDEAEAITVAERELRKMCLFAKCESVDDLEAIERRWDDAVRIDNELKLTEKQLAAFAAGGTINDLIRDAESVVPDTLPGVTVEIREKLSSKEEALSQVNQDIGSEKTQLDRMDGSSRAADAAENAQSSLAQIRDGIERYARLRLASIILNREMEQYRAKNQGPILKRASEIFAALTLGSFTGLRTDFDENDRPVLVGVRSSEEQVEVEGMSDGTCDQLYLSLRMASLERHLDSEKRMPFIIDDILVNFDDARAEATLKMLAELSRKTQVIFFTHHQHLIPLAQKSISGDILQIHTMDV